MWALSYMKAGRAAKWAAWIFQWEERGENQGQNRFLDWEDFRNNFKEEFCPAHTDTAAINKLESAAYYQHSHSIDDYLDKFQDLILEAGYFNPKMIVVKLCQGLDPQIQNAIATMASRRPSNVSPDQWIAAACTIDLNWATNKAFCSSYWAPNPAPSLPHPTIPLCPPVFNNLQALFQAQRTLSPGNPVPMDIDRNKRKVLLPITCFWCSQVGHKSGPDCPLHFDICVATIDELQSYLEDKFMVLDVVSETPEDADVEVEEEKEANKGFLPCNEWTAWPRCQTTIVSLFYLQWLTKLSQCLVNLDRWTWCRMIT